MLESRRETYKQIDLNILRKILGRFFAHKIFNELDFGNHLLGDRDTLNSRALRLAILMSDKLISLSRRNKFHGLKIERYSKFSPRTNSTSNGERLLMSSDHRKLQSEFITFLKNFNEDMLDRHDEETIGGGELEILRAIITDLNTEKWPNRNQNTDFVSKEDEDMILKMEEWRKKKLTTENKENQKEESATPASKESKEVKKTEEETYLERLTRERAEDAEDSRKNYWGYSGK